ncbi:hypothetical protein CRUP_023231 [Coryphaenoides rupestris]|nr:hypothetical protein CRUP_023231 [Coryphaenoides rupestris]
MLVVQTDRLGPNSGLHIIIFDEIDAICKQRGSMAGSTGVHDTVVNQLLSKIDGVEQLNNILVIGLPDERGRVQILNIHTAKMRQFKLLASDVDVKELAAETKNYSGAELEGLNDRDRHLAEGQGGHGDNRWEKAGKVVQKGLVVMVEGGRERGREEREGEEV